jgi:alpha-tubulin suppressor-like RCC1 family protein
MRTGDVWCWGANGSGQLGHRTNDGGADCTIACPAGPVQNLGQAVQVSAGTGFTCAAIADGSVSCWGVNDRGQLGRPTTMTCASGLACDPFPGQVMGVSNVAQVSAGTGYACAPTRTGSVLCWGDDNYGQLGTGSASSLAVPPTPVKVFNGAVDVATSLYGDSTCGVKSDGTVWCWGRNDYGALGVAPQPTDPMCAMPPKPCLATPTPVAGIAGVAPVLAGCMGSCVALSAGGFDCWGYDGEGCLGAKTVGPMYINLPPTSVVAAANLTAIDMRYTTTCGLDASGHAWCWGEWGWGALGQAEKGLAPDSCDNIPCLHQGHDVGLTGVTQLAVGARLGIALLTNGTVWAWGLNDGGQLGHPPGKGGDAKCPADTSQTHLCNATPAAVSGLPPP